MRGGVVVGGQEELSVEVHPIRPLVLQDVPLQLLQLRGRMRFVR